MASFVKIILVKAHQCQRAGSSVLLDARWKSFSKSIIKGPTIPSVLEYLKGWILETGRSNTGQEYYRILEALFALDSGYQRILCDSPGG
ncbi:unnamed protein product [Calicophoron daubneyi]|uniref:Uncharacterized protein n=1 Tax=Calicophoron daubneyi TaxID=300641 RepID=A0AAV2THC4_CALDB